MSLGGKNEKNAFSGLLFRFSVLQYNAYLPVAQLDSASDSDSEGRRFESCRVGQTDSPRLLAGAVCLPLLGREPSPVTGKPWREIRGLLPGKAKEREGKETGGTRTCSRRVQNPVG